MNGRVQSRLRRCRTVPYHLHNFPEIFIFFSQGEVFGLRGDVKKAPLFRRGPSSLSRSAQLGEGRERLGDLEVQVAVVACGLFGILCSRCGFLGLNVSHRGYDLGILAEGLFRVVGSFGKFGVDFLD